VAAVIVPAYLAGDNPRAQSGSDGSVGDWEHKRGLLADAVDRDGSFLDVGCASGYLMETLAAWCRQRGYAVEPYGLDIAPELADLARRRLPQQPRLVGRLLREVVAPGGRLIIGVYSEERDATRPGASEEERVAGWGFQVAGRTERPHLRDPRIVYRALWIDA
jgi:hypothetical protein